jgi:hypothetical protein
MSSLAPGHLFANAVTTRVNWDSKLRAATREFQRHINNHQSQLARTLGVQPQTVQSWFKLGRISPWGAIEIGKRFPTFPKERTRPDIHNWKAVKIRVPVRVAA